MAKKAYIGVDGVARKIKKGYIGIDGIARKIKKAYIGIGGVARPCWSSGELADYGTITPLSVARSLLGAASIGNYALFAGGTGSSGQTDAVDAYDKSLVLSSAPVLTKKRDSLVGTNTETHAIFSGGYSGLTTVDAYDASLTKTEAPKPDVGRRLLAATSLGDYALFGGGLNSNGSGSSSVDAYDTSLTRTLLNGLSSSDRAELSATTVGDYALFAGGRRTVTSHLYVVSTVDAYDESLTRTATGAISGLSEKRCALAATTVGGCALFAGGAISDGTPTALIDYYDGSLTKVELAPERYADFHLGGPAKYLTATTIGKYALIGGGIFGSSNGYVATVNAYDESLTRITSSISGLSGGRQKLAAASVGSYALFAGGVTSSPSDYVDAYTVN